MTATARKWSFSDWEFSWFKRFKIKIPTYIRLREMKLNQNLDYRIAQTQRGFLWNAIIVHLLCCWGQTLTCQIQQWVASLVLSSHTAPTRRQHTSSCPSLFSHLWRVVLLWTRLNTANRDFEMTNEDINSFVLVKDTFKRIYCKVYNRKCTYRACCPLCHSHGGRQHQSRTSIWGSHSQWDLKYASRYTVHIKLLVSRIGITTKMWLELVECNGLKCSQSQVDRCTHLRL